MPTTLPYAPSSCQPDSTSCWHTLGNDLTGCNWTKLTERIDPEPWRRLCRRGGSARNRSLPRCVRSRCNPPKARASRSPGRRSLSQNRTEYVHHVSSRGFERVGIASPRQRPEQYFTFSQSRAHFLRQAKGRPQYTQGLVGSSDFERIFAIELPGHGPASPVEEAAVGLDRQFIDDGQQLAGRCSRCVDVQLGR